MVGIDLGINLVPDVSMTLGGFNPSQVYNIVTNTPVIGTVSNPTWTLSVGLGDATVLMQYSQSIYLNTSGAWIHDNTWSTDMGDGAGHGVLYANQNLYWLLASSNTGVTNRMNCKILYKLKKVNAAELIGLVMQSNQN